MAAGRRAVRALLRRRDRTPPEERPETWWVVWHGRRIIVSAGRHSRGIMPVDEGYLVELEGLIAEGEEFSIEGLLVGCLPVDDD